MEEVSDKIRQEAAARIIEEYQQWLTQVIEGDGEKISKETEPDAARQIVESRQKIEQIAAEFTRKTNGGLDKRRHKIKPTKEVS